MAAEVSLRETYGKTLVELGRQNPDIVVLDADLSPSTMTKYFAREFPERFFDCGIAEQNMISIAAGLAASGKIPFASTFAVFAPGRCFDQLRISVAYPGFNVKLVSTHAGLSVGEDGASHQAIEDLALIGALPGFTVIVPADAVETKQAVETAAASQGPFYIRIPRLKLTPVYDENYRFELGKAVTMRQGRDVTIVAIGIMVGAALEAADRTAPEGIDCRVLNMPTFRPIDEGAVVAAARETGAIITAEEHLEHGGLGSSIARIVTGNCPVPMDFVAIKDSYGKSGNHDELLEKYGLTAGDIEKSVRAVLKKKG